MHAFVYLLEQAGKVYGDKFGLAAGLRGHGEEFWCVRHDCGSRRKDSSVTGNGPIKLYMVATRVSKSVATCCGGSLRLVYLGSRSQMLLSSVAARHSRLTQDFSLPCWRSASGVQAAA